MSAAVRPARLVSVEPRGLPGVGIRLLLPVVAVAGAAALGAVILALSGTSPSAAYARMFESAFGGSRPVIRTLVLATPLILTALAAAVAFRMLVWNIGAEGQLLLGAIAASGVALAAGERVPGPAAVGLALASSVLAGGLWAMLAAVPRAYLGTDEVITTLMLNFVALHLMEYLIFGSVSFWRDRERVIFPQGRTIPEAAELPRIWGRLHVGIVVAGAIALLVWWLMRRTRWGFELRAIGDSPRAARYAGMDVSRKVVAVLALSGALAGLAGGVEVAGVTRALDPGSLATNLGFTGIVVAAVARLSPLGIIPAAVLVAGLLNSGSSLQQLGVPFEVVLLLQGIVLLFVAAAEFLLHHRVRLGGRRVVEGAAR
jgi:simple sugar transport system permease protein